MSARACPVCDAGSELATAFLEENIDTSKLTSFSYASRKTPEFMWRHMVRCTRCDLVYADEPPDETELGHAYHVADYDSVEEAQDAAAAYIRELQPVLKALPQCESALEIGAGTGIFLEMLAAHGFSSVAGVEPSTAAVAAAPPTRRSWLREAMFEERDFEPRSFDLICCFMTLEHVRDPGIIAAAAMRLLKEGGAFVSVTHDYRGAVNRLLGRRSPILDIEHLQLFSPESIRHLYSRHRYRDVRVSAFRNRYSLDYWARLSPLPPAAKARMRSALKRLGMAHVKLSINVGNTMAIGFKREGLG